MIIGLSGYAKSGKDTVASMIRDIDDSFQIKKFSGKLKEIGTILTGIPTHLFESQNFKEQNLPGWDMTVREFLQKLGTDAIRDGLHENAWVNALFADYKQGDNWIITDVRFPNEIDMVRKYGGITVRVNRQGISPVNAHPSETALDGYIYDFAIQNYSSVEVLSTNVSGLFSQILDARNKNK